MKVGMLMVVVVIKTDRHQIDRTMADAGFGADFLGKTAYGLS